MSQTRTSIRGELTTVKARAEATPPASVGKASKLTLTKRTLADLAPGKRNGGARRRRGRGISHMRRRGVPGDGVASTWSPLLDGDLRERAVEAVVAIAESLCADGTAHPPQPSLEVDAASLASGDAGLALFFAYLARSGLTSHGPERAEHFLDRAQAALATADMTPSLYMGFTGIAWATEHLNTHILDSIDDDPNGAIDEALQEYVTRSPWTDDFDLVSGLVGIGVYALERLTRPSGRALLELVIDRLDESAERTAEGITWQTSPALLPPWQRDRCPEGEYNLGVAHGVPGVIALLGHACTAGVARATTERMLEQAVEWLLAQQLPAGSGSRFASSIVAGMAPVPSRSAWCYGDPGIAAALLSAARGVERFEWEREAVGVARAAANRRPDATRVRDAGLCHGATGLAHVFNRISQTTQDSPLADAARSWFARALDMQRPGQGIGGFTALCPAEDGTESWVADPGILTGAAGVGLALLAAITPIEPAWDRMLLQSGPDLDGS
jgi:class I lanthipeptide synthase